MNFSYFLIVAIILILMSLVFKKNTKNEENVNKDKIVFEFSSNITRIMMFGVILTTFLTCVFLARAINGQDENFLGPIVFSIFPIFFLSVYIVLKKGKVVYENKKFIKYNIWGKKKEFSVQEITSAIEDPLKGIQLTFNNKYKLKISGLINNYPEIKKILSENNIQCKDINGNSNVKGW